MLVQLVYIQYVPFIFRQVLSFNKCFNFARNRWQVTPRVSNYSTQKEDSRSEILHSFKLSKLGFVTCRRILTEQQQ